MANTLVGQTLGHYKILDQLGAGGMGVVYRAQDTKLGRQVALKVLPTGNTSSEEAVERFRREARTASSLNHPNICTIYGFDEHEGQLYLAMELLDGEPLDRRLSGRPLDLRHMLDIAAQVADALDAAHAEGILHRDVKPANIFLTRRGPVKVLDFGLAKLSPEYRRDRDACSTRRTRRSPPEHFTSAVGTTVGTIAYMSPEQARGDDVDPRTDLFSFGVVLYEMATGRQSFPGHTTAVVFDGILNRDPVPPSTLNAMLPPELDRIVSKALEKDRGLRYQTAADIGADLKRLRRDSASQARASCRRRAASRSPMDAATVVMPSSAADTQVGAPSGIGSAPTVASVPRAAPCRQRCIGSDCAPRRRRRGSGAPASASSRLRRSPPASARTSRSRGDERATGAIRPRRHRLPRQPPLDAAPASAPAPAPAAVRREPPAPPQPGGHRRAATAEARGAADATSGRHAGHEHRDGHACAKPAPPAAAEPAAAASSPVPTAGRRETRRRRNGSKLRRRRSPTT